MRASKRKGVNVAVVKLRNYFGNVVEARSYRSIMTVMILVTGGTGFIGRALIQQLIQLGKPVRTLLRPSQSSPNLPRGVPVEAAVCSLRDERGLRAVMRGVEAVYHLAGAERLGTRADLHGVDIDGSETVARMAAEAGVRRLVFLSHLGADRNSAFPVLSAKATAERHIINSGVPYTIFRSGPVFGPGDQFTLPLVRLLKRSPGIFLMPGDGSSLVQPLWINDLLALMTWTLDDAQMENKIYQIGGGEYFSFKEIVAILLKKMSFRRAIVSVNPAYLKILAVYLEQYDAKFPISIYWLDYLLTDRTCPVDTLPRQFGLIPARFTQQLDYLNTFYR